MGNNLHLNKTMLPAVVHLEDVGKVVMMNAGRGETVEAEAEGGETVEAEADRDEIVMKVEKVLLFFVKVEKCFLCITLVLVNQFCFMSYFP